MKSTTSSQTGRNGEMTVPEAVHPLFELDPEAVRCPYEFYAQLREQGPVTWLPQIEVYAVTRFSDISDVLRQPELFSSANVMGPEMIRQTIETTQQLLATSPEFAEVLVRAQPGMAIALLNADPPVHSRQRSIVNRGFTPRRIRESAPTVRRIANELIDRFIADGHVEFVQQFAVPLPASVIADRLGVPREDMDTFKRWSDDFVVAIGNHRLTPDQLQAMLISMAEFYEYFAALIEDRRRTPTDDMLSVIANAHLDGEEELSMAELLYMLSQLLVGGNESTTKLLASAMVLLLRQPTLVERLRADRALIEPFLEEVLRLEPPIQGLYRMATKDTEISGVPIPAGAPLWLVYASGNRDETAFPSPEVVDCERRNARQHLAFGVGPHYCLGAPLARLEAGIGIEILLDRLQDLQLSPDNDFSFEPSYVLHGLHRLDLTFAPGTPRSEAEKLTDDRIDSLTDST